MKHSMLPATALLICAVLCSAGSATGEQAKITAYRGAGCDGARQLLTFETFLGRRVDLAIDSLDASSWQAMRSSAHWIAGCWKKADRKIQLSIPMLPRDGSYTLAQGAAGAYDAIFVDVAKTLVEAGHPDAILRIGAEFNGNWFPWAASKDPAGFVAYWRRIATILRTYPDARFRLEWCPNTGMQGIAPDKVYPGDDLVDVIGQDVYNQKWNSSEENPKQRWKQLESSPFGLFWHRDFSRQHRKPMSYPEWGTGTRPDGHGAGDDPYFVTAMAAWIKANNVEYHGYWDYPAADYNAKISENEQPKSAKAFLDEFGTH